jgi:hypothetical protein
MRVALFLFLTVGIAEAQDKPVGFSKAFITVTNKGDFDLSLSLTPNPSASPALPIASGLVSNSAPFSAQTASNHVATFEIRKLVKSREQITFSIPKGDYTVEAITAPQAGQEIIPQLPHASNERANSISNNEVWTFELDKVPQQSAAADNKEPISHTWKRHVWPVRTANPPGTPGLLATPDPLPRKAIPAPPQNLRIVPTSP